MSTDSPVPEGTDEAKAAFRSLFFVPINTAAERAFDAGMAAALAAAAPYIAVQERQHIIRELEQADSALCDCRHGDSSVPISPKTGAAMDHHCDCRAVVAASILLGANSLTRHAQECGHGTVFDEFYTPLAARAAGKDKT